MKNKYKYRKYSAKFTTKQKDRMVTELYRGETQENVARKYGTSVGFISWLRRKWDDENLYPSRRKAG